MDFIQNGVKTLKRHSIANITDVLRNHIHRDSFPSLGRHPRGLYASKASFPLNNADFDSVSAAVVHLFQKKKLQENELTSLQDNIRNLVTTDAGPLIYDFYKDKLMKKGMVILRERIKHETGRSLMVKLGEQWDYFYQEIMPILQSILYPVKTKTLSIRQVALLEFRNTIVLKLPVKEALLEVVAGDPVLSNTQQMLLVLRNVHETPCTDNSLKLEKLVASVTRPYLGVLGLYDGGSQPDIQSNVKLPASLTVIEFPEEVLSESDEDIADLDQHRGRHRLSPLVLSGKLSPGRPGTGLLHHPLLQVVKEQDRGQIRRFSIATS